MSKSISVSDEFHLWLKQESRREHRTMRHFFERVATRGWNEEMEDGYDSYSPERRAVLAARERENT